MHLARRVVVSEGTAGKDRDEVLLVVDVRDGDGSGLAIDVVGELLVSDAGQAVPNEADREAGDLEGEVDRVQETDGCAYEKEMGSTTCEGGGRQPRYVRTEGVADNGHLGHAVL